MSSRLSVSEPDNRSVAFSPPHVQGTGQVGAQVRADRVALPPGHADAGRHEERHAGAAVGGDADRADGRLDDAALDALREAHDDARRLPVVLGDQVAPFGRLRVAPAQEVERLPVGLAQVARDVQPGGLTFGTVHERGADLSFH